MCLVMGHMGKRIMSSHMRLMALRFIEKTPVVSVRADALATAHVVGGDIHFAWYAKVPRIGPGRLIIDHVIVARLIMPLTAHAPSRALLDMQLRMAMMPLGPALVQ